MAPIKEWFGLYNVIFGWFESKYGSKALEEYYRYLAENCFDDVIEKFRIHGLQGIKDYYEHTFDIDQGEYDSEMLEDEFLFTVKKCPDYQFMLSSENQYFKPMKNYCKHHEIINSVICENSGHCFRMLECDGKGECRWSFRRGGASNDGT